MGVSAGLGVGVKEIIQEVNMYECVYKWEREKSKEERQKKSGG